MLALRIRGILGTGSRAFSRLFDVQDGDLCMLSLYVENQNTNIGRRNIHSLKRGCSLTLGGGTSDFLIFLTPLPARIAEIYFDGKSCTLLPLQRQFFPDILNKNLPSCTGQTIRIKTAKNYDIYFRLLVQEAPLKKLRGLFSGIKLPGQR